MEVEIVWKIPDWLRVGQSCELILQQNKIVDVGSSRWEYYFREFQPGTFMMCLKLVQLPDASVVQVSTTVQLMNRLLDGNGIHYRKETGPRVLKLNTLGIEVGTAFSYSVVFGSCWFGIPIEFLINTEGELVHRIKLKVEYTVNKRTSIVAPHPGEVSVVKLQDNMETLLENKEFHNFKIFSKDGKEFRVNKHILASRCPVFESMFRSNMEEANTGEVHVNDVSGPAMEILIKYWYTGKLADNWREPGVVVDFTRAVGKYGISELLEFLDGALAQEDVVQSSLELLETTMMLDLKQAERSLFRSIKIKVSEVNNTEELFAALGSSSSS